MYQFKEGDKVNYKPVGGMMNFIYNVYIHEPQANQATTGANSKTNKSVGVIREITTASDNEPRYRIENMNTHKSSSIKEGNIEGPAE
jgi:hypothetical protein